MDLQRRLADADTPVGTVLVSHGYAEHSGRYSTFIDFLVAHGYDVFWYDHAGHGSSQGRRACQDVGRLILDHLDQRRIVLAHARTKNIFLFGHSMGGLITAASSILDPTDLRGVVLSGPAFQPLPVLPEPLVNALLPTARIFPALPVATMRTGVLSRNPAVEEEFNNDPMCYTGCVQILTGLTMLAQGKQTLKNASALRVPTLVLHGSADELAAPEGSRIFVERARAAHPNGDIHLRLIDGARHEILNEPEGPGLMRDILLWLNAH
ncbi:MAG: lysophospholipase [Actinobacteria bacterium]|nr:MAG: lysophospholipase [Actinomycetota bacterium]